MMQEFAAYSGKLVFQLTKIVLLIFFCLNAAKGGAFETDDKLNAYTPIIQDSREIKSQFPVLLSDVFHFKLEAPVEKERELAVSMRGKDDNFPPQIGFGRGVGALADAGYLGSKLKWIRQPNGDRLATIAVGSATAQGVRLSLRFEKLDPRMQFVFADSTGVLMRMSGMEIIDQMAQAGEMVAGRSKFPSFITPLAAGEDLVVGVTVPSAISTSELSFAVNWVSHVVQSPVDDWVKKAGVSLSCQRDIACGSSLEQATGNSVARMVFSDPATGGTYTCSGTLLNNRNQDRTPYFLTAAHCISNQSQASTLQTYWFYQSLACGTASVSAGVVAVAGGASILYTSASTDTSFLRLNSAAPAGATFAGWYSGLVPLSTSVFGIHHPGGDVKKISYGLDAAYGTCSSADASGMYSCQPAGSAVATHHVVGFTTGTVEPGSSGSGLFVSVGGGNYLVGQLKGGNSVCSSGTATGVGVYGRFDIAYANSLNNWLSPGAVVKTRSAVYRFYNTTNGTHFFTGSSAERDSVIANLPNYRYEGAAFYTYSDSSSKLSPVYRFYNSSNGAHFYTISAVERDFILSNLKNFNLEGIAWFAATAGDSSSTALYRFYNLETGTHFYTVSLTERDSIISNLRNYRYEGEAYQVWTSP